MNEVYTDRKNVINVNKNAYIVARIINNVKKVKMVQKYIKKPRGIEAIQFTDMDSYMKIVQWMKDNKCTYALADEVEYRTNIILLPSHRGTIVIHEGDWIIKEIDGSFIPCANELFKAIYIKIPDGIEKY